MVADWLRARFRRPAPKPAIPPNAPCACGAGDAQPCYGREHHIVWDSGTFKGTRCDRHGGHKFMPALLAPDPERYQLFRVEDVVVSRAVFQVKIGDKVRMVRHNQTPAAERPPGPYEVIGVQVIWDIDGPWPAPDVFFELQHPDGWQESRPWYLVVPAEKEAHTDG